ncbi:MAG: glycine cleavage system protein H [Bacteroidota bacterium]
MVAIFMLGTILLFLTIDYFVQRARKKQLSPAAESQSIIPNRFLIPRGYFFSKGHSWVELLSSGSVRIGIDDFTQKILGSIDGVHIMTRNVSINRGEPILVLKQGDRVISVAAPVSGKIVEVNKNILEHPELIKKDPYITGWIARIEPENLNAELQLLKIAEDASQWLRGEVSRFRDFINHHTQQFAFAHAGVTMADGGIPMTEVLEHANDDAWQAFEQEFLLKS